MKSESNPWYTVNKLFSWLFIWWVFKVALRIEQSVCIISHGDISQGCLCRISISNPVVSLESRLLTWTVLIHACYIRCGSASAHIPCHLLSSYTDSLALFLVTSQLILQTSAQVLRGCWGPCGIHWTSSGGHSNPLCGIERPQQPWDHQDEELVSK